MILIGIALVLIGAALIWWGSPGNPAAIAIGVIVLVIGLAVAVRAYQEDSPNAKKSLDASAVVLYDGS